jgi:uncharacterized membrane protein
MAIDQQPDDLPADGSDAGAGDVDRNLDRLAFFSDAVMAIAMTLLALDLKVPQGNTNAEQWRSFIDSWGDNYFPFVLSFVLIAAYWSAHHRFFRRIVRLGPGLVPLNMAFLFMIVVLPFATRMVTENGHFQVATVLYSIVIAGVGLSLTLLMWWAWHGDMLRPGTPKTVVARATLSLVVASVIFLLSIPIAFVNTTAAKYSWLVLWAVSRLVGAAIGQLRRSSRGEGDMV